MTCALHVRLFDGASIRGTFPSDASLQSVVRPFVTEHSHTDQPYNFRLIAHPPRTIEISEEGQSLRELGLCPNATLVLVPVRDFTNAYSTTGATGIVHKGIGAGWSLLTGAANVVTTIVGRAMGFGITGAHARGFAGSGGEQTGKNDDKATTEAYNGNTLSVEPRPQDVR